MRFFFELSEILWYNPSIKEGMWINLSEIINILARELGLDRGRVENVVRLLEEGNTIPFIARYRKEAHGAMDDTALRALETRLGYLRNL